MWQSHQARIASLPQAPNPVGSPSGLIRANYYLGRAAIDPPLRDNWNGPIRSVFSKHEFDRIIHIDCSRGKGSAVGIDRYMSDMQQICLYSWKARYHNHTNSFPIRFGDNTTKLSASTFVKARSVASRSGILLPLNVKRHWRFSLANGYQMAAKELKQMLVHDPYAWNEKVGMLFWRGTTTGLITGLRRSFVSARLPRHSGIDIRFNNFTRDADAWVHVNGSLAPHLFDDHFYSLASMLKHKYLLSLEGNDVATDLKWKLASRSVVVMPPPTKETWLMEGLLVPYLHYVPVESPHELLGVMEWMRSHDAECQEIVRNANAFVSNVLTDFTGPVSWVLRHGIRLQEARVLLERRAVLPFTS